MVPGIYQRARLRAVDSCRQHPSLVVHIVASVLVALVAFPVAVGAVKGSRPHVYAGRVFTAGYVVICLSGLLLTIGMPSAGEIRLLGVAFNASAEHTALADGIAGRFLAGTIMEDLAFLYFAISGWRIWARARAADRGDSTRGDAGLAILAMLNSIGFVVFALLIVEGIHAAEGRAGMPVGFTVLAFALGGLFLLDAARDLQIVIAGPPKRWWAVHLRKMALAELMLVVSFVYRCTEPGTPRLWPLVALVALVVSVFWAGWHYRRRLARAATPA